MSELNIKEYVCKELSLSEQEIPSYRKSKRTGL